MTGRGVTVLAIVTLAVVVAAVLVQRPAGDSATHGGKLFPQLLERVNSVTRVLIKTSAGQTTLIKNEKGWTVHEKGEYPAASDKLRELVLGMAQLERIEAKTRDPELYSKLQLEDVTEKGARSTLVQLQDADGKNIAALIIGQRRPSASDPKKSLIYARIPGELQAWLVEGSLPRADQSEHWLDRQILNVEDTRVRRVLVTHADGSTLELKRAVPGDKDFHIEMQPGEKIASQYSVNAIASTLRSLALDDVIANAKSDSAPVPGTARAVLETFDGLRVNMQIQQGKEKTSIRLGAGFDENLLQPSAAPAQTPDAKAGDGKSASAPAMQSSDKTRAEAQRLNAFWQQWEYVVPAYQLETIMVKRQDLLAKPQEEKDTRARPAVPLPPSGSITIPAN